MSKPILWAVIACLFGLSACTASTPTQQIPTIEVTTETPTPVISSAQQEIQALWRKGPHSKIRIQFEDVDYSCARCHSPREWDSNREAVYAPDCAAAVVNSSQITSSGTGGSATDLSGWHAVDCAVCHRPLGNGEFSEEVSFWNQETGAYEAVATYTELCEKCHRKSESIDNSIDLGTNAHASLECTDCHEPHRTTATCANSVCHPDVAEDLVIIDQVAMPAGHDTHSPHTCGSGPCHAVATQIAADGTLPHIGIDHGFVTCAACHDASNMYVGPTEGLLEWNTWQQVTWNGLESMRPYFSHNVTGKVDCTRCHYEDNPWKLPFPVKSGQPTAK